MRVPHHEDGALIVQLQADLAEAVRLMEEVMKWDNNALDDPSVCNEYKADIEACLDFIAKHKGTK